MTVAATDALAARIREALRLVVDPELGDNIVDLGLVYFVSVDGGGQAHVVMTTTSRGCPAAAFLRQGVRDRVKALPGVAATEVVLTYDPPWTPDMVAPGTRLRSGIGRWGS